MRKRAYAASRSMTWERTAERYVATIESARRARDRAPVTRLFALQSDAKAPPDLRTEHFFAMCDDTGLFQHAVGSVPDRAHGYCVDDNARALLLACALNCPGERRLPDAATARFAAFVQHAWNPDLQRFRNFMSFDRRWLESSGSEDSHGRTLWALGACARHDVDASRRLWAADLFARAAPIVESFTSPRAWAFTLLGLEHYCAAREGDQDAERIRLALADRLVALVEGVATSAWTWFETGLTYENARLPQALIVTGLATRSPACLSTGLRTLRWLTAMQTTSAGLFRPIGTEGFGEHYSQPKPFDQQPVEAAATISACLAAYEAEGDARWALDAKRAFAWFLGANDLSLPLVDVATGSCRDGLHADRANENRGGESAVCYLLGLAEMRALARMTNAQAGSTNAPRL